MGAAAHSFVFPCSAFPYPFSLSHSTKGRGNGTAASSAASFFVGSGQGTPPVTSLGPAFTAREGACSAIFPSTGLGYLVLGASYSTPAGAAAANASFYPYKARAREKVRGAWGVGQASRALYSHPAPPPSPPSLSARHQTERFNVAVASGAWRRASPFALLPLLLALEASLAV